MPVSDTYRCSFDAKVNGQDVRIRTLLVQFGAGGLLTALGDFVLIGSGMMLLKGIDELRKCPLWRSCPPVLN
jgi:hypothetical protein